jgi:hypothetical protein
VTALWSNPEFVRHVRAQLRPGKVIATACICAAVSIAVGFGSSHQGSKASGPYGWGTELLLISLWIQILALAAGGGIACVNSIYREKEHNTFDYQRVTRLTPLELTIGKLFGAPVLMYFVFACLMPLALFGAVMGKQPIGSVLAMYVVVFVASLAVHALGLLISLLTVRGSHTGAILLLLVLLWGSAFGGGRSVGRFQVGSLGPFYAVELARAESWESPSHPGWTDMVFGHTVDHLPVLVVVDLAFLCWFLLAVTRNIKRDSNYYELYSPLQGLGFAMFLNLLFVAFFPWGSESSVEGESILLTLNMVVFYCLGLAVIRNRERVRRLLRSRETADGWLIDQMWPAPYLTIGALAAGLIVVAGIAEGRDPQVEWNGRFALLRMLFFVAWVARDVQFLQWMNLRRGKHSLATGVLFLAIFYVCVSIVLGSFGFFTTADRVPFTAFFIPSGTYLLDHSAWTLRPAIWMSAFVAQWLLVGLFIWLQGSIMRQMEGPVTEARAAELAT